MKVTLRGRIYPFAWGPVALAAVVYFLLVAIAPDGSVVRTYPFGIAGALGLLLVGWRLHVNWRTHAIELDDRTITDLRTGTQLDFSAIAAIRVEDMDRPRGEVLPKIRCVTLQGPAGTIRFGDLGAGPAAVDGILNLPASAEILAYVVHRTASRDLFPETWDNPLGTAATPQVEIASPMKAAINWRGLSGAYALLFSLVPKFLALAFKILKTIKPGAAILTFSAYGLLVSWPFAAGFLLHVGFHECGHVYAMFRCGLGVKGIYFVPFFGGAAVSHGHATSARDAAFIAINGPAWGAGLSLALWFGHLAWSGAVPILGALAAWGALINLFNLLPIVPLDGGKIISALVIGRSASALVMAASLVLGLVVAYLADLQLLSLMAIFGLGELSGHLRKSSTAQVFSLLPAERTLDFAAREHFLRYVTLAAQLKQTSAAQHARRQEYDEMVAASRTRPMTSTQSRLMLANYAVLVLLLLSVIWSSRPLEGAGEPWELLR